MSANAAVPTQLRWKPLEEVAAVVMGQSPPSSAYNTEGEGLPFFQGKAEFGSLYPAVVKWCTAPTKIAEPGDVLMSVRAPVGPTNLATERCCIGRGLAAIRPLENVRSKWLLYAIRSIEGNIDALGTGTTFKAISGETVRQLSVPVASLGYQDLVVGELEKQLSRLDQAVGGLMRFQMKLKRYKAAVLMAAVEDRLILSNGGVKATWTRCALGEVSHVSGGLTKNPKRVALARRLPYLRVANVYANELRLDEIEQIGVADSELPKLSLMAGDLLVVEGNGSKDQIGRLAIWDGSIDPCVHQNHLIKVRVSERVLPKWVLFWLLSRRGRRHIEEVSSSTSGLYTLSVNKVAALPIALPPLEMQKCIVAEVESRLSLIEGLEADSIRGLRHASTLRKAILSRAFVEGTYQ